MFRQIGRAVERKERGVGLLLSEIARGAKDEDGEGFATIIAAKVLTPLVVLRLLRHGRGLVVAVLLVAVRGAVGGGRHGGG